jgi:hypothetical protein
MKLRRRLRFVAKHFVKSGLLASTLLFLAPGAFAAPVTWTIAPTTLSGTSNSLSGTFVWNADTQALTSVNVTVMIDGTTSVATLAGSVAGGYLHFEVANSVGAAGAYLASSSLSDAGGIENAAAGVGACSFLAGPVCGNNTPVGSGTATVTGSVPATPAPIATPALSTWVMIGLCGALLALGAYRLSRPDSGALSRRANIQ